jgi:hypothetical protein
VRALCENSGDFGLEVIEVDVHGVGF